MRDIPIRSEQRYLIETYTCSKKKYRQTKIEVNKKSNFKISNSGIKFLYIISPASLKPLSEQRLRNRKLFFSAHSKLVSASHSKCNSSFQIKAKSHTFFYISSDISLRGRRGGGRKNRKKTPCNHHFFFLNYYI